MKNDLRHHLQAELLAPHARGKDSYLRACFWAAGFGWVFHSQCPARWPDDMDSLWKDLAYLGRDGVPVGFYDSRTCIYTAAMTARSNGKHFPVYGQQFGTALEEFERDRAEHGDSPPG